MTTVLAIGLAVWVSYRRATICDTQWLDPALPAAQSLFRAPTITALDEGPFGWRYTFTYCAERKEALSLELDARQASLPRGGGWGSHITRETTIVSTDDRVDAESCLAAMIQADVLTPGTLAIRGRVVDRNGKALARATIQVYDDGGNDEEYGARDDGTFTIILPGRSKIAPAGRGFWFKVQASGSPPSSNRGPWTSRTFSLDPKPSERVVIITVPRK